MHSITSMSMHVPINMTYAPFPYIVYNASLHRYRERNYPSETVYSTTHLRDIHVFRNVYYPPFQRKPMLRNYYTKQNNKKIRCIV